MMRDYAELIKGLRHCSCAVHEGRVVCDGCPFDDDCAAAEFDIDHAAADAIEELLAKVRSVVHCRDCEWWTKQDASIQGRCARLAIYPTGEFYCAGGSKAEPPEGVE